ncbi:hypothetical protein NLJ89_g1789 [Agrocybe chaxingu]|uniref:Pet127-domain-containing protein n=1 Tax=Agrocybe chaxingu TaxID=84603 RepID=A0A9W8MZD6_9AGAR|nr:hypothetical protein NLJ89_g1789 [Agrocybe chaxingu]
MGTLLALQQITEGTDDLAFERQLNARYQGDLSAPPTDKKNGKSTGLREDSSSDSPFALESELFPADSKLVPERWKGDEWTAEDVERINSFLDPSLDDRPIAPHILKGDTLRSGVLESNSLALTDVPPRNKHLPISTLKHNLDRVLFSPGVHWLQDPRSRVYNFSPWLEKIPKVNDFAFERLAGFIKSSRDEDLRTLAKQEGRKFAGSTSSLSGMLSHIYFLLSEFKDPDFSMMSQHFKSQPSGFTSGQRMPVTAALVYKDGVYAVDSHTAEFDDPDKNVLTWMGTLLEHFLTKTPEKFKKFLRRESEPIQKNETPIMREAFRFSKSKEFVMRSQLDCQDHRLPGTGVFDLKTRACVTIRMDILNFEENSGYLIRNQHGLMESFEKEYYDLIRSAFLKYGFQARIGNMDGVMVTYHNTERIFGFQYIPLDEMDERLFGPTPGIGDKVFTKCVELLEAIVGEATKCYPEQSVLCSFETKLPGKVLDVFVQPMEWDGPEETRPISKLCVKLDHRLDNELVKASVAMRAVTEAWTVDYEIMRPHLSEEEVRIDLSGLNQRKMRSLVLPSSVPLEDAEQYWTNLSFNKVMSKEDAKIFRPESFSLATAAIERYRELAREGRLISQRLESELAGRPKIVLGEGIYEEEESLFLKEPTHSVGLESSPSESQSSLAKADDNAETRPSST